MVRCAVFYNLNANIKHLDYHYFQHGLRPLSCILNITSCLISFRELIFSCVFFFYCLFALNLNGGYVYQRVKKKNFTYTVVGTRDSIVYRLVWLSLFQWVMVPLGVRH